MKQLCFTLLFCCAHFFAAAQVSDNFSDNDFTADPEWVGDDSLFTMVSGELRLNGSAGEAHLATAYRLHDSTTWLFRSRFLLSPSTQNFARFYLVSDKENLEGPLNGYYVQLGGATGTTDSITLYKQSGTQRIRIIAGRPATVSKQQNTVSVKVFRDSKGNWSLYSDTSGGANYAAEGFANDTGFTTGNYLGWFIKYTAGNSQRFYLDDVAAFMPLPDRTPPEVERVVVEDDKTVAVYFNEDVDPLTATDSANYTLTSSGINPTLCELVEPRTVRLRFAASFVSKASYELAITAIQDLNGNAMAPYTFSFLYYTPARHDLLISEFMPDPVPAIGLPEQEFVEIYNNTAVPINTQGYTLSDGSSTAILPNVVVEPRSFAIVCSQAHVSLFASYGNVIGVSALPSLNNTSDELVLKDTKGQEMHRVSYDQSWFSEAEKKEGGCSLELNYPNQLCRGRQVYAASKNSSGGTPGSENSLWDTAHDNNPPKIASVSIAGTNQLYVVFSEPVDTVLLLPASVVLQPAIPVDSIAFPAPDSLLITFKSSFSDRTSYHITLNNVTDCSGNTTRATATFDHVIPREAQAFDVLIHEIMADPEPAQLLPDAEYIELYNRSSKTISLKDWTLHDAGSTARIPDVLLAPDSFVLLTGTTQAALFNERAYGVSGFPSLGNDGDELVLKNGEGQVIHAVAYSSSWYQDGFKKNGGWSLEMVDAQNPCGIRNWKASVNPRGGTPGEKNSVRGNNKDLQPPQLMRAYPVDSSRLQLVFNEALDSSSFRLSRFLLNGNTTPVTVSGEAPFYASTTLHFADAFQYDVVHTIMLADSISDCARNLVEDYRSAEFLMPYEADSGSLVINEVLFNAKADGYDFVELYNRGNKPVDLKTMLLGRRDPDGMISDVVSIAPGGFVLNAGAHAVITTDPQNLRQHYYCKEPALLLAAKLPAYNDDEGAVVLLNTAGRVCDEFTYHSNMHFPLLDNPDGVSQERIDYMRASQEQSNWTSAAASVGYATPTYRNSQYVGNEKSEGLLSLQPSVISPDGDGYHDIMNLNYSLAGPGFTGNLQIYDASGRLVKQVLRNEVLGSSGTYSWNGSMDNGNIAPPGIYLFHLEVFTLSGAVKKHTAVGVVAVKL